MRTWYGTRYWDIYSHMVLGPTTDRLGGPENKHRVLRPFIKRSAYKLLGCPHDGMEGAVHAH